MRIMEEKVVPDEKFEAEASGSNIFDTINSAVRNRQRRQSNSADNNRSFNTNQNRRTMPTFERCSWFLILWIVISMLLVSYSFKYMHKEEINENADSIFEAMAGMADSTSEELSELDLPGTSVTNRYRAVFLNLGAILNNSDVISQNGVQIARDLFKLSDDFKEAGRELSKFMDQADDFFYSLSSELSAIMNRLNQKESFFARYYEMIQDETDVKFIKKRLKTLSQNVPKFQAQLKRIISALRLIEQRSIHTQEYLMTGEKEAQQVLKDHWLGKIADYNERKRAEEERHQVLYVLKLLKNMTPNLLDFQSFLDRYQLQLQDLETKINTNSATLKPSKETLKYLIRAAEKLETSHKNFKMKENRLEQKPKYSFEDEMNAMNRDCTEFEFELTKSNGVYLKKLRIWSSNLVNALAFFYSDDSVQILGTPGSIEPYDFEWHKDEKIKHFTCSFSAIVYGFEIITTKGRSTGWRGGDRGHRFYTDSEGREFNGLFGSFSKYICSLEVCNG